MKTTALTATQIDTLAQRLSDTPIIPATSAKKAGNNFARLLTARIGAERAALGFTSILTAATADQAKARLILVLDYGNASLPARAARWPKPQRFRFCEKRRQRSGGMRRSPASQAQTVRGTA
jgi:hypothetical protein